MRRFAWMNFQITTELDSKLSYTPCYMNVFWWWRKRDAYLLVLRLKHGLQTWGSSTHRGLVNVRPSAIKKNTHRES